ncbi:MAG TPA: P-loop NTPase fold protein [Cellvibrionaceae bacterium]
MNTDDYWEANDCLDRKQEALDVITFLQSMHGQGFSSGDHQQSKKHFTLNVTAEWGAGKTFFLKGLLHDLKKLGHTVVYFDAWKNDLSNDPIASFIAQISDGLLKQLPPRSKYKSSLKKSAISLLKATAKVVASAAVKKTTGYAISELTAESDIKIDKEKCGETTSKYIEKIIDEHLKQPKAIEAFKKSIGSISSDLFNDPARKAPIFIIIDELDRCRPTYAVQLLENVKHIFETNGIYIIFGTHKDELMHTIRKVYGQGFNAEKYLRRFFDMQFALMVPHKTLCSNLFDGKDAPFLKTNIVKPNQTDLTHTIMSNNI